MYAFYVCMYLIYIKCLRYYYYNCNCSNVYVCRDMAVTCIICRRKCYKTIALFVRLFNRVFVCMFLKSFHLFKFLIVYVHHEKI